MLPEAPRIPRTTPRKMSRHNRRHPDTIFKTNIAYKTNSSYKINELYNNNNMQYEIDTSHETNEGTALCIKYLATRPHYIYYSQDGDSAASAIVKFTSSKDSLSLKEEKRSRLRRSDSNLSLKRDKLVTKSENITMFVIVTINADKIHGCIIDKYDTYNFIIVEPLKNHEVKTIRKHLQNKIVPHKLKYVPDNKFLSADLSLFCQKFCFMADKLSIGIIYIKRGQNSIDTIFSNDYSHASLYYRHFLQAINVSDTFDESNPFDDVFNTFENANLFDNVVNTSIKVRWYPSTHMNSDQIRQYIGNSQCVILFYDDFTFLKEIPLDIFGKITRIFICVSYDRNDTYSVGVIRKNTSDHVSIENYVTYSHDNIYREILQRANNNTIQLKKKSDVSELFIFPREVALNTIRAQYT